MINTQISFDTPAGTEMPANFELDESLHEVSSHEEIEYPVATYFIQLSKLSMNMIRWHWHEELEVVIVNSGNAVFQTEEEQINLTPGQGIMINQNLLHTIYSRAAEDSSLYSLMFHPSFIFGYGNSGIMSKYLSPVLSAPSLKYLLLEEGSDITGSMLNLVNDIIACNLTKQFGYELRTKAYLCDFWHQLLTFAAPAMDTVPVTLPITSDGIRVKQAIRYMEARHTEQITLDDIAASIHVSKSECCRCFKRTLGLTPFEYLLKFRIFESTRKIHRDETVSRSISDLAVSVGFNSTSYFNKLFKKYLHCTPSEYKRQILNSPYAKQNMNPIDINFAQQI